MNTDKNRELLWRTVPFVMAMLLLALTPLAERALRIDERDIQTGVDFQAERPRIDARIVCTIRIGQIVVIALAFGVGFLKQKMHSKQARATRAKTAPAAQERKVSNG